MVKPLSVKLLACFLAFTLLSFPFISLSYNESHSFSASKNTLLISTSSVASGTSEPCEEKEGKDTSVECQTMVAVPPTYALALSRLMAAFLREKNKTISAFGDTTNRPLYLAKRSFLI